MEVYDPMKETFKQYRELNEELKNKEKLYEEKVIENEELDSLYDGVQFQVSECEKKLNSIKDDMYYSKRNYMSSREKKHDLKVFVIGFIIPFIFSFNLVSLPYLTCFSFVMGIFTSVIESAFFGKINKKRYGKDYVQSSSYRNLKSEYDEVNKQFTEKLNEFNDVTLEIHKNENELDRLKKEINDIKYSLSRMVADIFRKMEDLYYSEEKCSDDIIDNPIELSRKL